MPTKFVSRKEYDAIIARTNQAIADGANPREMAAECSISWSVFDKLLEKKDKQHQISVLQYNRMTAWLDSHEYGLKKCLKCGRELPLDSFNKHARRPDGHQDYCRECAAESKKEWRQKHKESEGSMANIAASVVRKVKEEDKPEYESKFMAAYFGINPEQLDEIRAGKWDKLLLTEPPKPADTLKDAVEQLRIELAETKNLVEKALLSAGFEIPGDAK